MEVQEVRQPAPIAKKIIKKVLERDSLRETMKNKIGENV